jgi:hypothetical protein
MPHSHQTEEERSDHFDSTISESVAVQEEAAGVLRDVAARLERISREMRKVRAFPFAEQIDREKRRVEDVANGHQ